jgi:hypothetical protein
MASAIAAEGEAARGAAPAWASLALVALAALILSLPVLANGFPFYFNDSADYIHIGRDIVDTLMKRFETASAIPVQSGPAAGAAGPAPNPMGLTLLGGRSAYFGLLVAALMAAFGAWGPVLLQALLAAWTLWLAVRVHRPPRVRRTYLAIVALLTLASSLPIFVGFVMPDLYAGLAILAALLLALHSQRLARAEQAGLFLLAAASGAFHTTIWVLVLVAAAGAGAMLWLTGAGLALAVRRAAPGLLAAGLSVAGIMAFGLAVQAFYGVKIDNPPFLMARVLEDGPGRAYLAASCAEKGWAICAYRDKPLTDANRILWDPDRATGVFFPADYETRRRMNAEEKAFVLGSTLQNPGAQAAATLRNGLAQLALARPTPELAATRQIWRESLLRQELPHAPYLAARVYRGTFPLAFFDTTSLIGLAAALAFLGWRLTRPDMRRRGGEAERLFLCLALALVATVAANALLCGAASGPSPRYQTRLIWLVPALALIGAARFGLSARRSPER